jgi:hypothetical protein
MSAAKTHLREWWKLRSEDQRAQLKRAAAHNMLGPGTLDLLLSSGCPVGPIGTKWEAEPDFGWSWSETVRTFITEQ